MIIIISKLMASITRCVCLFWFITGPYDDTTLGIMQKPELSQ